jgi:hypothetical protein
LIERPDRGEYAVFALLLLGTLAVYFAVDGRLALPVFALGLLAATEVVSRLLQRATGPRAARGIVAGLLLLLAAHDAAPRRDWEAIRAAHAADLAYARAIGQRLSPADVLAAPAGWHLSVLLDRPVWNLAHAGRREGFAGVERVIAEHGITTVAVRTDPPEAPNLLGMLETRYGSGERTGASVLVRTRP